MDSKENLSPCSGGGKSSIVNLLERHYLASAGAVLMDGRDVGVYDAKWLKRRVALVSQVRGPQILLSPVS